MKEIKLPSGALLKIGLSPFAVSKALYQAFLKEIKPLGISAKSDFASLYKDLFCVGFSSPEIEKCLWECFKRCTLDAGAGDLKIDEQTFEPLERRDDYMQVCIEVCKENVMPFMKSLIVQYQRATSILESTPK